MARTIREEHLCAARLDRARSEFPRLEEVWTQVSWVLARNPMLGALIPGTNPQRYLLRTVPWPAGRVPSITVMYHLEDYLVCVDSTRIGDEPNELPHEHTEA
jgi:hypothetical protein